MPETKSTNRIINDVRLIAGYLRDAALSSNPFVLTITGQEIVCQLIHIEEAVARDKKNKRRIIFQIHGEYNNESNLNSISQQRSSHENFIDVLCRVALDRFLIKFSSQIESWENDFITILSPGEATLSSSRGKHRFSAKHLPQKSALVAIKNEGRIEFGYFEIKDISSEGFGGYIETSNEISNATEISGTLKQDRGSINLSGEIKRIQQDESYKGRRYRYKVGISHALSQEHKNKSTETENKRKATRLIANFPIEISSPLNPRANISLEVLDISYSGISARFFNKADSLLFKKGITSHLSSPKINLRVLSVEKDTIKLQILPSALQEHIQLFVLKSTLGEKDLALKTPIPEDILQVYSVSGSLSSALIGNIKVFRENILHSLASNSHSKPWLLRWMQQSDEGRIRSIIMTVPYGEHLWYCGGAAGHMDPTLKASSNFFKRFFNANIEFLSSLSSKEYMLFNWFTDNTRWSEWEKFISEESQNSEFFRFDGEIAYFTSPKIHLNQSREPITNELKQGEFDKIDKCLGLIDSNNIRRLLGLLGLNSFSFGAKSVRDLLNSVEKDFDRKCFHLEFDNIHAVMILSSFPSYVSPNGILNYPFVITNHHLSETQLDILGATILKIATANGVECFGFFLSNQGEYQKISRTENIQLRKIRWSFGPAEIVLKYWIKNEG